jgi:hypothetical protein
LFEHQLLARHGWHPTTALRRRTLGALMITLPVIWMEKY